MKIVQAALVATAVILGGCATVSDPGDPYEPFNRGVYRFNHGLDKAVVQPAARAYRAVLPPFVRASVGNVFSNIGDVRNVLNNGLQGKLAAAYADLGRVFINSTLGLAGLFDIASEAGIEKHNEDFGQTLGAWGARSGSFLVLPILGPSSSRDALGTVVDYATNPMSFVDPTGAQLALRGVEGIDDRVRFLEAGAVMEQIALDPYLFMRDAYLQRRKALVRDGRPAPATEGLDLVERRE